jgi:hypothetical protein
VLTLTLTLNLTLTLTLTLTWQMTTKGHSCGVGDGGRGLEPCGLRWPQARGVVGVEGLGEGGYAADGLRAASTCLCGASFSSAFSGAPALEQVDSFHSSSASGSASCATTWVRVGLGVGLGSGFGQGFEFGL